MRLALVASTSSSWEVARHRLSLATSALASSGFSRLAAAAGGEALRVKGMIRGELRWTGWMFKLFEGLYTTQSAS